MFVKLAENLKPPPKRIGTHYGKTRIAAGRVCRQELIGQIAIGVAHEIRNPLTVIKGYLQFLEHKPASRLPETLDIILQEVDRIEALLADFISVARNKAIVKKPENLNRILEEYYPVMAAYAASYSIAVELSLGERIPVLDLSQPEIQQLVMHLVRNGVEAMPAAGRLAVGTVREAGVVVLYIRDEGIGIPAEQLERIFDPFYTTKAGSTGLGLAIVLGIAERHQGKIEILSQVNVGTTLRILFPISRAQL
ncbi:two-component system sensor histidine kinase NtrB [Acetonema longum]|uniref:histidine kinase n=1 Tax=Acetonema longum DSM 6540 TaxID=1009370 RepID=F7NHW5_9FIRM|nr:ATP-binding protein [Acetonema longum]EGO64344.1 multi-sensor signal transduction histidine kinase [Acetonema longum DSM 6540]